MVMTIAFFNQFSGINLIGIYSTSILGQLQEGFFKQPTINPIIGSACVGVAQLVGCLIAPVLLRVMGMRSIFIGGQTMMGLSLLSVKFSSKAQNSQASMVAILAFLIIYQAT